MLKRLFGRKKEERFHVSQEPPGWVTSLIGTTSAAGVTVNEYNALYLSTVYACVRILSESVAGLPCLLYRRLEGGGKEREMTHPLYRLLHDMPNPEMSSFELFETVMNHLVLWGNAYCEITWDGRGQVSELWPLRPDKMEIKRESGAIYYYYTLPESVGGRTQRLPAEKIWHLRGMGLNGLVGYSPITLASNSIGMAMAAEDYGSRFFANGARPGGVLEHPGVIGKEAADRLRSSWNEMHSGIENAHKVAILEEGMKFHDVGIPPQDAQYLETRRFQVAEIARIYRVPLHMLADLERATFSNIEHQSIEFVSHSLRSWLVRIEKSIYRSLLLEREREALFAEFLVDALMRGDTKSRYESYAIGFMNGWLSQNDIRGFENLNPIENGDQYYVPMNVMAITGELPAGNGSLPDGRSQLPLGNEQLPTGRGNGKLPGSNGSLPTGREQLPEGNDLLPEGSVELPGGNGSLPEGREKLPVGNQKLPVGNEQRAKDNQGVRRRRQAQSAQRVIFEEVAARILKRELQDVGAQAKRLLGEGGDMSEFEAWLERFYLEFAEVARRLMSAPMRGYAITVTDAVEDELAGLSQEAAAAGVASPGTVERDRLDAFVESYIMQFGVRHATRSQSWILQALRTAYEEQRDRLEAVTAELEAWQEWRPANVAHEEAVREANAVAEAGYRIAGISRLRSVAFGDSCPYCRGLDGKVIGINEYYLEAGKDYLPEGATSPLVSGSNKRHAPYHDGCDCMTVASLWVLG